MKVAAKRIAAGKWGCNSGQACVSPDYVVTTKSFAPKLVVIQFQSYFLVPTHAWSSPSIHPWLPANNNVSGLCSCSTPGVATLAAGVPEASAVRVLRGGAAAVAGPVARRQLQPLQQAHGPHGRLLGLRQCRVRRPDRRAAAVSESFTASKHALFPVTLILSSIAMPFNIIIIIIIKKKHFFAVLRRRIAPTLLLDVPLDSAMMKEEIFGPLLPIITVRKNGKRKKGMLLDQQRISLSLSGCAAPVLRSMKNLHSWMVVGGQDRRELRCDQLHAQAAGSLPLQQRRAAQAAVREDRLGGRDHVQRHRHPRIYAWLLTFVLLSLLP